MLQNKQTHGYVKYVCTFNYINNSSVRDIVPCHTSTTQHGVYVCMLSSKQVTFVGMYFDRIFNAIYIRICTYISIII